MAKPSNLNEALLAVSKAGLELIKDSVNPHFKNTYASLGAVLDALKPALVANDLVVTQFPATVGDGAPGLWTQVTHVPTGETLDANFPLVLDKATMQGVGSAITYARRYALVSIFGLDADEDDDGNAASGPAPRSEPKVVKKKESSGGRAF